MRQLRLREVKQFTQGHRAIKCQNHDLNTGLSNYKVQTFNHSTLSPNGAQFLTATFPSGSHIPPVAETLTAQHH